MVFEVHPDFAYGTNAYSTSTRVRVIASTSSGFTVGIDGFIAYYTGTSVGITPYTFSGFGTYKDWAIQLTGARGFNGFIGATGATGSIANPLSNIFTITNTTSATSTVTGALQVVGGVGVGGNAFIGNVLSLTVSAAEPIIPITGMFAVADRVNWDPASKGSGNAYPVFYDGAVWNALY
jgi:hypothetical protein